MYAVALMCLEDAVVESREGIFFALPGVINQQRLRLFYHLHLDSRSYDKNLYCGLTNGVNPHMIIIYASQPPNSTDGQKFIVRYTRDLAAV